MPDRLQCGIIKRQNVVKRGVKMTSILRKMIRLRGIEQNNEIPPLEKLYKDFLSIAWPAALEGSLITIIGSIDTMMVGKLGSAAIAAIGLTNQPRMILMILAQALCVGTTAIVARRKGAGERDAANWAFGQSFAIITVVGLLIVGIGYFGAPWLMNLAGANEDTLDLSTAYFRIVATGFIFNCWSMCICAAMRAIGKTKITMITNLTANVVNVCLNYCLIGGHLGFPALGVRGAAIATAVGTFIACCIALVFATWKTGYLKLTIPNIVVFDKESVKAISNVGVSSMAESVFLRLGFLVTNKLVAGMGTDAFASYQIVSQVTALSFTIGEGLATAGATLIGQSLGAKRTDLARINVRIARRLSVIASVILMAAIAAAHKYLGMLFTQEADILQGVSLGFFVVVVGFLPQNGRVVYSGCLRGAGDTRFVALCALMSVAFLRPALTYLFCYPVNKLAPALRMDVTGPWLSFILDAFVRNYMLAVRIKRGKWLTIKL